MEQVLDNLDKGSYDTETLGLHNPHIDGPNTSSQAGTATENNSRLYENTEDEPLHSSTAGIMDTCGGEILVEAPSKVDISLKNTCKGPDSTFHGENSIKEENGISKSDTEKDLSDEFEEVKELNKKDLSLNLEHMDLNSSLAKHISGDISPKDKITYAHTPFEEMNDTLDDVVRQPAQFLPSWQSPHTAEECYKMEKEIVIREGTAKRNADSLLGKIAAPEEIKVSKCKNDEKMESKENTEAEVTEEKKINTELPQSEHEVQSILEHIGEKLAEATTMQFEDKYLETTNAVKDIEEKLVTEEKIVQENEAISDKYENTSTTALDQIQSITIVEAEARDGVLEGEVQSRDGKDESDLMAEEQVAELSTVRHKVDIEIPNNEPNSALAIKISAEENTQEETTRPRNKLADEVLKESETQRKFGSSAAQITEVVYPLDGENEGEQNGKITEVMHDVGQCCEREPGLHDKEQSCEVVVPEQDEMITLVTMRYMPNFSVDKVDDSSKNYETIHGPGIGKLENASEDGHVLSTTDTEAYNYGSGNDYVDSLSVVENAKSKNPPTLPEANTEKYINKRITEEEPELQKDESENSKFESNSTAVDLQVTGKNVNPEIENKDKEELVMYIEGSSQEDKDHGTHKVTTDMMHEYQQIMEKIDLNEGPQTAIRKQADNHEKDIGYMSDSQQLAEEKIHENVGEKPNQAPDSTYDRQIHQTSGSEEPAGLKEETETKMSEVDSAQSEEWIKGMIGETKTTKIENTPGDNMFSSLTMLQASNEVHKPEGYVHSVALNEERKIKDKAILEEDKIHDREILEPSLKKIDEIPEETANNRRSVSRLEKDLVENSCELESQEEPESISMRKNTDIGAPNETKSSDGIVEKSFSNTSKSLTRSVDVVNKRQILGEEGPTEDADSTRVKCEVVEVMIQEKDNRNVEQVALENDYRSQSKESNEFNDNVENGITSEEVKEPDLTTIAQNFELVAEEPRIKIKLPDDDEKPVMKFDAADAQSYDTSTQQKKNYNIAAEESEAATSKYEETIIKSDDHSPDSPTIWSQELIHEVTNNEGDMEVDVHLKEIASVSNINSVSEPEYQNQNVTVESEAAKVDNPTSNDEPSYKIPDADLSDDTKTVKVKDEQKESIDEICDNQVSIVQITPATSLEKNEEASTCMYEEQIHRVTNRGDNEEAEAWEEKTNSEKLKIITDLVPEDQSAMTTSEFEAIKTHDLTYDNLENKNTSTIHLSEENENVDNKNEEPRDKKRDYSEVTSGLDEAESMSLNGVQKESTIKADDMEDKILNQKNYNVVADNKENEAANLKDEENIKQSDCSPIVPAIGEETRQELTKEKEKITHGSFGGQIHEGIRENDSINFDIQKEENKSEKIESSSAVVMNEEKCKKTSGVEVFENRSKVGTSTVSLEAFEEKTNLTASSSDDNKPSHEVRDTSKSKGDMSIVESKGTGGEAAKLGMQRQAMEGEEMNEVYALASEVTYKSFEKEMNQEGRELMKERTLDANHGIDSGMATKKAAIVDESLEEQNLDEDEAFKGIEEEVKDTNLISQRFETPAEKRHVTSDDERNFNPMNDVLTEQETSVENITQKYPSIVVSEGLINDVMEDSEIRERNILEKADNKKGDTETSFEIDSLENEKRDEGTEIQPEKKLSDAKGINERKKNESTEENKIAERSSKNEKYEDVGELENPANVLPEGSQRENENIKRDNLEKEGINATLEEYPHKDGHKILEIETTNSEPLNQCNQQVLSCDNTERIIHHDKIVESENASEGVRNVDEIHEDNADSNESVEEIMKTQSIGSPLQMEKMEFQNFEAFEEQLESIKSENEEKPDKNETLGVNSQKDVKEVLLKRLSNDELDRVETAESSEQIEDIIAEKNINDAPDPRVGEDATHERMHKDEIEAEKNDEPEAIKKSAAIDITSEPPNDEVTEFNGQPFEHNTLIMGLTEETETKSSLNEENEKEMPGISVITSAEETMQEAGHKLVEVSDIIPSEGDEIPEVAINVLLVTDCSKTNTINPEGGGDIGEASKLVPEEEVDKRNIPLTEVKENEEKPNKFSVKQKIETCPVTKERERMSQTQEASLEVAELDELLNEGMNLNELPLSRSLMNHNLRLEHEMLDKTGGVDSEDKPKENESKHCNDVVVSNQETMFSSSPEQVTEDNIEAEKKLENTSDLMLEKEGNGVKKNTKDLEDDNCLESSLCDSSSSLAVAEAMIAKHEGISISSPAEQMKEEESILEDKKERSIIQNYNIAAEESEAATSKYEETIIKSVDHSPDTPSLLSQELIHEAEGDTEIGLHLKEIVSENNIISVSEPEYQSQDLRVESEDAKVDNPTCNKERSYKIPNADLSDDTKTVKVKDGEYLKESIDDIRDNQILMMQITPYTALEKHEEASPSMYEEQIHKVINRGDNEKADAWEEKTNSEKLQIMTDLVPESQIQKTTSEFEATKIHDSTCDDLENKNYNAVGGGKEKEAANLKDEENIKHSVCSPIIHAIGEETRQESPKEHQKAPHATFKGQIHEGISENDSINFNILKEENKIEKIESSYAIVMDEEKWKKTNVVEVIENDSEVGTSTVSLEAFEEKTNITTSSSDDDEVSLEARETSKSKGDKNLVESKGTDGEEAKLGIQDQSMKGEKMNEAYALASEVTYKSFENEMNQKERTPTNEGTLDACHGIDSDIASKNPAMVDEADSLQGRNLDEDEAFKGIDEEVKDTNLISRIFETTVEKRHVTSDDERNCNPMEDDLSEQETSVEKNIEKHASMVVSEGHIHDIMEDGEIAETNILEKANNEKRNADLSLEILSLENENQGKEMEIEQEKKLSDVNSINERNMIKSTEENKFLERCLKNENFEDVEEFENPAKVLPEGLQTESANINRERQEKEGVNDSLEEWPHKDGHKILEIATTNLEPLNQSTQQVLSCDNTECVIHHDEIVESENASEEVGNVNVIYEDNADSDESVEEITKSQSIGSPLQMEKMELETVGAFEEQLESIKKEDEEKPHKNETSGVNSQNDVQEVQFKSLSNDELDRVETAESSEQIEDIIAENDINDPCVVEDATHEPLHKDEIEAKKNDEPKALQKSGTINTTSEPSNDEVTELNCVPFKHNTSIMALTEEIEAMSSLNDKNVKEIAGISVIRSAEETMQEAGQKLVEVSDNMPGDGEEIPEENINVLRVIGSSKTNTIKEEGGGDIGEVSQLVSEEEVNKRGIPLAEVKDDEERSNKFSVKQNIEMGPPTEERERMSQTQEASLEVAELDELPVSRLLMEHILRFEREAPDKTCDVDSGDKAKENDSQECNDVVASIQGTVFSSSLEEVKDTIEADKKLENTSDLMLENQSDGVKENTEDLEDVNSLERNRCGSSSSLAVAEAMITEHEGISIPLLAEQMKEEENISEDKKESSMKVENACESVRAHNIEAKGSIQNVVVQDDKTPRTTLCEPHPTLTVGDGAKEMISEQQSYPDSKVDTEHFREPALVQDDKIHANALENKMTKHAIQKENESANKSVDISPDSEASQKDVSQEEGEKDGNEALHAAVSSDSEASREDVYQKEGEKGGIEILHAAVEMTHPFNESVGKTGSLILNEQDGQTGIAFESFNIEDQNNQEPPETESQVVKVENAQENQDGKNESQVQNLQNYSAEVLNVSKSHKVQQSDLLEEPTNGTVQVSESFLEKRNPAVTIEEQKIIEATATQAEEEKTDEEIDEKEEEDEHKTKESGHDTVVIVQDRDANSKPARKKSHNILAGVGTKVKHSFAKVKKAITGKSTHSKTASPK